MVAASDSDTIHVQPLNVTALAITQDQAPAVRGFAGATIQEREGDPAGLETRSLHSSALHSLPPGVHVHWTLPEEKTRGIADKEGMLAFAHLPDTWLVVRFGGGGDPRRWIVDSDYFVKKSSASGEKAADRALFLLGKDEIAFLGRTSTFDDTYQAPDKGEALGGVSAVANGLPHFAAYYPDCRSVFGFHDDLTGVGKDTKLSYLVVGWQRNTEGSHKTFAKLTSDWDPGQSGPARMEFVSQAGQGNGDLFAGMIVDVDRAAGSDILTESIEGEVALGSTPSETLAAYFRHRLGADDVAFEKLLTALQMGQLDQLSQAPSDQLARLNDVLHEAQFRALTGGTLNTIVGAGERLHPHDVPPTLRLAMHKLNAVHADNEELRHRRDSLRWQMLTDWYRLQRAEAAEDWTRHDAFFNHAMSVMAAYDALDTALHTKEGENRSFKNAVNGQCKTQAPSYVSARLANRHPSSHAGNLRGAAEAITVQENVSAPRYWQPTEPVVVLALDTARSQLRRPKAPSRTLKLADMRSLHAASNALTEMQHKQLGVTNDQAICIEKLQAEAKLNSEGVHASGPSGISAVRWSADAFTPAFMLWNVDYYPLHATEADERFVDYPVDFFTRHFRIDPKGTGSFVDDRPQESAARRMTLTQPPQSYSGQSYMSLSAAQNLARHIDGVTPAEPLLTQIAELCRTEKHVFTQPIAGLNEAFLLRESGLMQQIEKPGVATSYAAQLLTEELFFKKPGSGRSEARLPVRHTLRPLNSGSFNPLRGGYFAVSLELIDVFGRRRKVDMKTVALAASVSAGSGATPPAPSMGYLAPRFVQPARLLFQWLPATQRPTGRGRPKESSPLTVAPVASPICGWLLPNHLQIGFFVFSSGGRPLGTLTMEGGRVRWQTAPGMAEGTTEAASLALAMQHANPQLANLVTRLAGPDITYFDAFWKAIDAAQDMVHPDQPDADNGLSILVGRPLALVQAGLCLDLQGLPPLNPSWRTATADGVVDTDHGITDVAFPVLLGDPERHNDGLIGFFTERGDGYDLDTFHSEGAATKDRRPSGGGVVRPSFADLSLTAVPTGSRRHDQLGPSAAHHASRVLMLVDPRAKVHAVTGILPTQTLSIAWEELQGAMSALEMWFPIGPILKGAGPLALPVPREEGMSVEWVARTSPTQLHKTPEIVAPLPGPALDWNVDGLSAGWLCLTPDLLEFKIASATDEAPVLAGQTQTLKVTVINRKATAVGAKEGATLRLHFAFLLEEPKQVSGIRLRAGNGDVWARDSDDMDGILILKARIGAKLLPAGASKDANVAPSWTILLENVPVAKGIAQATVHFEYAGLDGLPDSVHVDTVAIHS